MGCVFSPCLSATGRTSGLSLQGTAEVIGPFRQLECVRDHNLVQYIPLVFVIMSTRIQEEPACVATGTTALSRARAGDWKNARCLHADRGRADSP